MKFMFIADHEDGEQVTLEADCIELTDVRAAFYRFLAGCGYDVTLSQYKIDPMVIKMEGNDE